MAEGGDAAQAMVEGCIDCATGVWYIINVYGESKQTRYRADSEVSQVLEDAYQKRNMYAVFQDKDTKSIIRANMKTNLLYVEGIPIPHAHIERVVEKRKEPLKEKETVRTVVGGSQSRQTISNIKDAAEFQDASKCEKLLRELKEEAASLIELVGKTDLKMQQQLQKELQECKMKVQEVSKKCFKEDFPYQWEKFEMRLEFEKENKFFSSALYTIMDVSPVQMQYIVGNTDERDSLLEQLGKRHFRGVFELGFLRIFLQEDEDIRKMVANPNYSIYLEKEVIKVLNTHIRTDQVIKETKLSQFGMEDVLQAKELGHLECIKSGRVKIYIHKSGKGVSIVGREVDKYIQSICKALEQVSKNEPKSERTEHVASSVSETNLSNMKFDTDILSRTSLEHAEESKELKKYENANVCVKELGCTKHVTQMLADSDYAAALSTDIPEVAVNYISNKVVFQGPPKAVIKAECHLKHYLKSKGFWYEVELAESHIELYKILKFEEDLQRKCPEVYIKFDERKVIFIGEEKLLQTSEDELRKFEQSIKRAVKTYDKIIGNYLKLKDVQKSIWEQFENRQIRCYWQVLNGCIIHLFCKSDKELRAAMSALEECIVISHLSIRSESDLQEFENYPDVKKLINQNQGRLHRELIPKGDCVVYVSTLEVIAQIEKLHDTYTDDQKYEPHKDSLQILLSQPLLAYITKYLIENMKQIFQVNIQNLNDLSGISISGAEDDVQNAVSELQKQIKQMSVDIYPLKSTVITKTFDRQVKEIVARVEEETKTVIEIVSLPRRGKDIMRVTVCNKLDVCLVYGSTPGREVDIQFMPVNNSFFPICLASFDIMEKGVKMHPKAVNRYFAQIAEKQEMKKPEAFQFAYDDSGSNHHIVYFVVPVDLNDLEEFKEKFKCGLLAVLNDASQKNRTSLSIPLEMHEKLSAMQMVTIIMETIQSFLDEIPQDTSIKEIILCSVEKYNQSHLRKVLDAVTPDEQYVTDDFFGCEEGVDNHVDIAVVTGTLLEQEVEVIVNLTSKELNLAEGYLTKKIFDAAGKTIQDECRNRYREGIKFGEIAVTSAGKLKFRKIFHGALCLPDVDASHLLSLRSLMKNCLKKAQEERCQSIAFPALGLGRLKYPVDAVAKEMFRAVTTYAMRYGVKRVKFVMPEKNTDCLRAFKEIEKTRNKLLQDSQDGNPGYEASLNDCNIKIVVADGKKVTMCDVVIVLGNPTTDTPVENISLKSYKYILFPSEKKIAINRDPRMWSETLYLPLENEVNLLEEELHHALFYVKLMKFTSCAVDLSHLKKEDDCMSAMKKVFQVVNACKSDPGDLERVTVLISDNILQKEILFSEDNVTAPYRNKSLIDIGTGFTFKGWFGSKSQMTWKMLPDRRLTYLRITGMDMNVVKSSYDAVQKELKELSEQSVTLPRKESESKQSVTWYVINRNEANKTKLPTEICQWLEDAYIDGKSTTIFRCEKTGSTYTACLGKENKLAVDKNPYAQLERGNATLEDENTDNQAKDKTSSSVSSNHEKDSDFVEVQEWQKNDDNATLEDENTDNQAKDKTASSVSCNHEKEIDVVEVQKWQENDGNNYTLPLCIKYKRAPDKKIIRCMKNIPCSWKFLLYWNFYTKTEPGKQMLHEILNKYKCSVVVITEDEDLFIFEISENIFEQESDVVQLIHVVLDSVHKCAQQFLYLDNILIDQRIQGDVLQVVRQRKELDVARFELIGRQDFDALYVICTEKDKTLVLHVVTEIIHMVKECFENHEETIGVDYKWQKVMKTFEYLQKLCEKYPSVTIISDKTKSAIVLKGPRDQSKPAVDHFLELLGTVSTEVQEEIFSPGCQFEIFTYPEMCGYIDNITMEHSIVWIPNHQTKKIHLFSKKLGGKKGLDKLVRGCVQERFYPLAKDQTVFSTKVIRTLEEFKKMHTGKMVFSSSHRGLLLTASDDIFESIDDALQEIICEETEF